MKPIVNHGARGQASRLTSRRTTDPPESSTTPQRDRRVGVSPFARRAMSAARRIRYVHEPARMRKRKTAPDSDDVSSPAIERRFRKQRSSARQNASPTSAGHCHGARTRCGPRGGGRLRVLSAVARAPAFRLPAAPAAPGQPLPCGRERSLTRASTCAAEQASAGANHRERCDVYSSPETASLAGGRLRGGRRGSHCRQRGPAHRSPQREGGSRGDR